MIMNKEGKTQQICQKKTKTPRNILEHAENKERNTLSVLYEQQNERKHAVH